MFGNPRQQLIEEDRAHDAPGGLPPVVCARHNLENTAFELSTIRGI